MSAKDIAKDEKFYEERFGCIERHHHPADRRWPLSVESPQPGGRNYVEDKIGCRTSPGAAAAEHSETLPPNVNAEAQEVPRAVIDADGDAQPVDDGTINGVEDDADVGHDRLLPVANRNPPPLPGPSNQAGAEMSERPGKRHREEEGEMSPRSAVKKTAPAAGTSLEDGKADARNAEDESEKELHASDQAVVAPREQLAAGCSAAEDRSLQGESSCRYQGNCGGSRVCASRTSSLLALSAKKKTRPGPSSLLALSACLIDLAFHCLLSPAPTSQRLIPVRAADRRGARAAAGSGAWPGCDARCCRGSFRGWGWCCPGK